MNEYRIDPLSVDHFPSLKKLFKSAFGTEVELETLYRKYDTDAVGGKAVSFVAIENASNEVVAHYAALPVKTLLHGLTVVSAQTSDAMTAENHRKKGLFKELAHQVHEKCRQDGVSFLLSQPNDASSHAFLHVFGFQYVDDIIRWDLKLKLGTAPLAKLFASAGWRRLHLRYCAMVLKKYAIPSPAHFTNTLATNDARILRDESYLAYKQSPDKLFLQIDNAVVWVKLTDVLWIGDIDDYRNMTERVLRKLRRLAFVLGYNTISFHLNNKVPQPAFLAHFKKHNTEPSTIFYLNSNYSGNNMILAGADFDTW